MKVAIMELMICWRIPRLRLAERGVASWQDGDRRSRWRCREPSRRAGWSGRRCCLPTVRTRRSLRWGKGSACIIRRSSAASSGRGVWAAGHLERRDAEFEQKMAEVLCVYREVQVLKKAAAKSNKPDKPVAIVSYDEKPGI